VLALLLILSVVAMACLSPSFLQVSTLPYVLQFVPVVGLLGLGQTLIILSGGPGIDLSAGAMMSLSGLAVAGLIQVGFNPYIAALAGLGAGVCLGAMNGVLVAVMDIPSLIATLSMLFLYSGLAVALTDGRPLSGIPESFGWLGQGSILGLPNQLAFIFVPVAIALHVMLRHGIM